MGKKQSIIIGHFQHGKSVRALARELGINRRTVDKYIKEHQKLEDNGDVNLIKGGIMDPPRYDVSSRSPTVITPVVIQLLEGYETLNARHRAAGRYKQQMKQTDMHEALLKAGHQISYTSVCRAMVRIRQKSNEAYIRQDHRPGEQTEFDWGEVKMRVKGKDKRLFLAVFTLAYSNHRWAMLFHRQDMVSFLTAHREYFSQIGHVPRIVTYDNMRTAVSRFVNREGRPNKQATDELLRLSAYYVFDHRFCNIRRGNEKGHVERSVEYVRRKAFSQHFEFDTIEQANEHLLDICRELNQKSVRGQSASITDRLAEECQLMRAAPAQPFDPAQVAHKKVDKYSCICVDTNHYSVPDDKVGRMVEVRIYALHLEIYDAYSGKFLARHIRHHTSHQYYIDLGHFLSTLRRKPGALLGSLAWQQAANALRQTFEVYFDSQAVKDFVDVMIWVDENGFPWEKVQQTLQQAASLQPHRKMNADSLKALMLCHTHAATHQAQASTDTSMQQQAIQQHANDQLAQYGALFSN